LYVTVNNIGAVIRSNYKKTGRTLVTTAIGLYGVYGHQNTD